MAASAATQLRRALEAFRREQGLGYVRQLAGEPPERNRARAWLCSEQAIEALENAAGSGELPPAEHAALAAHMARACLEQRYESARVSSLGLWRRSIDVEGDTRRAGELFGEWSLASNPSRREQLARALDSALGALADELVVARARADRSAGELIARIKPARHPDAGPEGGSLALAERWLSLTEDVTREAVAVVRRAAGSEVTSGLDALWVALGPDYLGLFPREGRLRRLAADWEPLGLRRALAAHGRAIADHPGPFLAPHVVLVAGARDVRLSPSDFEVGLASELAAAESVGRALGFAHTSAALPLALRHPTVGSVARSIGTLGMLRFTEPLFLRRARGLSVRESQLVSRVAAAFALIDSRLSAAAVLARPLGPGPELEQALGDLARRALTGTVLPGVGAFLLTRLSPGGPFRAKTHASALLWSLREQFDDDWFFNPRAAEPLRGALARGGELSVEGFAQELGTTVERGPEKLSELF